MTVSGTTAWRGGRWCGECRHRHLYVILFLFRLFY